jgi:hypothetical protein
MSHTLFNCMLEDLQALYADIITKMFNSWTRLDDDACEYVSIGTKQVWTMNSLTAIYQPVREKGKTLVQSTEEGCVVIYPNKEFENINKDISLVKDIFDKAQPLLRIVENKLFESYNSYITKYGGWIEDVSRDDMNINRLLNLIKPLHFDEKSNKIKIKWTIKYLYDGVSRNWNPVELMNWMYSLPSYISYRKSRDLKDIQEIIGFLDNSLSKPLEERDLTNEQTKNIINRLKEKLTNPIPLETEYNEGYDDEYIKEKVYKGFKLIGEPLSGSKRKSDDESNDVNSSKKSKK